MRNLFFDMRYGLRLLSTQWGFTLLAVATLAVGIASTTTVFGWVDGILRHPFPGVAGSDRLAAIEAVTAGAPSGATRFSWAEYREFRDQLTLVSGLAAHRDEVFHVAGIANSQPAWGEAVSANYFEVLGVRASLGRTFTATECGDAPGACPVAVVSHAFWRDRLGASIGVIGKPLRVNRKQLTVIGVTPPEFRGTVTGLRYDLWTPLTMSAELGLGGQFQTDRSRRSLDLLARLRPGVTVAQSRDEAAAAAARMATTYPDTNRNVAATVVTVGETRSGAAALLRAPLGILLAISLLVLLIVCANVANLLLARSVTRTRELSLRVALGASRARVAQQLMAEALPLAGAGAFAGLQLAFWMAGALPLLVPRIGVPLAIEFPMNWRVLAFAIAAAVGATLAASLGLVWLAARTDLNASLKEGGRGGAQGRRSNRAQAALVVSQVALAAVSLVSAGLLLRSFEKVRAIHPGFDAANVAMARFYVSGAQYTPEQMHEFFRRLQERVQSSAGVVSVGYGDYAPLGSNAGPYTTVQVEGYAAAPGEQLIVSENLIAPGYLETLGIPVLEGRGFHAQDTPDRPPVLIVSETFARKFYNGASPVGRRVFAWGKWRTIVGMARDSKHFHSTEPDRPYFYSPLAYSTNTSTSIYFLVRTAGDPRAAIALVRNAALELDADAPAVQTMLLRDWIAVTLLAGKVAAYLMAVLSAISLLLCTVGLYSAMAYAVSQRTREFGVRMALGASMRNVLSGVLRQSLLLTGAGLMAGMAGALLAARLMRNMLVEVSAVDPATYLAVACFLIVVSLAAGAAPARRAAKVDPMVAMRHD